MKEKIGLVLGLFSKLWFGGWFICACFRFEATHDLYYGVWAILFCLMTFES